MDFGLIAGSAFSTFVYFELIAGSAFCTLEQSILDFGQITLDFEEAELWTMGPKCIISIVWGMYLGMT